MIDDAQWKLAVDAKQAGLLVTTDMRKSLIIQSTRQPLTTITLTNTGYLYRTGPGDHSAIVDDYRALRQLLSLPTSKQKESSHG
jgi:hypothetical protein